MIFYRVIDKYSHIFLRDGIEFDEETEIGIVTEPFEGMIRAKWDFDKEKWVETVTPEERLCLENGVDNMSSLINVLKERKTREMGEMCHHSILSGFKTEYQSLLYHFSYDQEAQLNFQETYRLFENNIVNSVMWTATLNGGKVRIFLEKDDFYNIYFESVKHKMGEISRYRDIIIPQINNATSPDDIISMSWEGVVGESIVPDFTRDMTLENRIEQNEISQAQGDVEILSYIMMGGLM